MANAAMTATTVETGSAELVSKEQKLSAEVSRVESLAKELVVSDDESFDAAGDFGIQLKTQQKKVVDFFEPMRKSTYEAYKSVNEQKASMLKPLENAEKIVKKKISDYQIEQRRKRQAEEEALRRKAEAEAKEKMEEAVRADAAGDVDAAEAAFVEAQVMENVSLTAAPTSESPKKKGVISSMDWEITSIDSSLVPTTFAGVEIRPVDTAQVMSLIRASKGKFKIPGITYEEKLKIGFRR